MPLRVTDCSSWHYERRTAPLLHEFLGANASWGRIDIPWASADRHAAQAAVHAWCFFDTKCAQWADQVGQRLDVTASGIAPGCQDTLGTESVGAVQLVCSSKKHTTSPACTAIEQPVPMQVPSRQHIVPHVGSSIQFARHNVS